MFISTQRGLTGSTFLFYFELLQNQQELETSSSMEVVISNIEIRLTDITIVDVDTLKSLKPNPSRTQALNLHHLILNIC